METKLSDINLSYLLIQHKIEDCEFIQVSDFIRLYYMPTESNGGFHFMAVEWSGNDADKPTWSPDTYIEILLHGWAAFDGVRHLYFGHEMTDNEGYFNYPDVEQLVHLMAALNGLQLKYCSDFGGGQ